MNWRFDKVWRRPGGRGPLSEKSHALLFYTRQWADYMAASGKIEAFPNQQTLAA